MWAFWNKRKRKAQLRAFADFVSEDGLREIENSLGQTSKPLAPLKQEMIRYVILQVRGDTPEDLQRHLAQTFEIVIDNDGVVEDIISSILTAIFKPTLDPNDRSLDALLSKLGPNVRAVHGQGEYPHGVIGSQRRFSYGTIFPDIEAKLLRLFQLKYGTSEEI